MAEFEGVESGGSDEGADSTSMPLPTGVALPGVTIGESESSLMSGMAPSQNTPEKFAGVEGGDNKAVTAENTQYTIGGGDPHSGTPPDAGRTLTPPALAGTTAGASSMERPGGQDASSEQR